MHSCPTSRLTADSVDFLICIGMAVGADPEGGARAHPKCLRNDLDFEQYTSYSFKAHCITN